MLIVPYVYGLYFFQKKQNQNQTGYVLDSDV